VTDPVSVGYDAIADEYARHIYGELDNKPFDRAFLLRFAAATPPGRVLDLGCGPGHIGRHLAAHGRDVLGIDLSPRMIALAQELNAHLEFRVADMRSLPLESGTFAGIASFYSIIHLKPDEIRPAFCEMHRVLGVGGTLALAFHVGHEVVHIEELWGVKTCLDFAMLDPEVIQSELRHAGFEIVEAPVRSPYDPAVEAQTERCYVLARRREEEAPCSAEAPA
jgi:SAM-dependent methyltransferase